MRQHERQLRRVGADGRVVQVGVVDPARDVGTQVAAEVERRTEGQQPLLIEDRAPLHAHLPLDARDAVVVRTDRRAEGALAHDRRRRHDIAAVDVAPVVLGGHTHREVPEDLPAQAELHLRHVALALVGILHGAHVAHDRVAEVLVELRAVAHRTVGREAEAQAEPLGHGHLEGDVVEVERIVDRAFGNALGRLRIVVVLAFEPEAEQKGLLRRHAIGGGIEQVDDPGIAHGHAHAAHRTHHERAGRILFTDTVHRIGRECVDAARLRRHRHGDEGRGHDKQSNPGILHLHCTPKFSPARNRPDYNLQISYF